MQIDANKIFEVMKEDQPFYDAVDSAFRYYLLRRVDWLIKKKHGVEADFYPQFFRYATDRRREPKLQKMAVQFGLAELVKSDSDKKSGAYRVLPAILELGGILMGGRFEPVVECKRSCDHLLRAGKTRLFLQGSSLPTYAELYSWLIRPELFEDGVLMHTYNQRFKGEVTEPFSWFRPVGFEAWLWESQKEQTRLGMLRFDKNLFGIIKDVAGEVAAEIAEEQLPKFMTMDWEDSSRRFGVNVGNGNNRIYCPENAEDAFPFVERIGSLIQDQLVGIEQKISALREQQNTLGRLYDSIGPSGFKEVAKEFERDLNETLNSEKGEGWIKERIAKNYKDTPSL